MKIEQRGAWVTVWINERTKLTQCFNSVGVACAVVGWLACNRNVQRNETDTLTYNHYHLLRTMVHTLGNFPCH